MQTVKLKPGREKSLLRRHPWIFSGAIDPCSSGLENLQGGDTVDVFDSKGNFLARGAYSPQSQIRIRIWTWGFEEQIDEAYFRQRLGCAITSRRAFNDRRGSNAYRLFYGESDGLPGLIIDVYGEYLVIQLTASGVERWRETLADLLIELTGIENIYERSDVEVRKLEGLALRTGVMRGSQPPDIINITEYGLEFLVDIQRGQKTGFYLDQKANRKRVRELTQGCEVLDCFSYTGGFALSGLIGGAVRVTAIESSPEALNLARRNLKLNNLSENNVEWIEGDVFQQLRRFRDQGKVFDLIVLDPPKFAATSSQISNAARGYKDINLLAFKLLRKDGILTTFSCSGSVDEDLFQKIVAGAALDAGIEAQILERLHQGPDHPVALNFPEGAYLKGLVIRLAG